MNTGFTGPKRGMTPEQRVAVVTLLERNYEPGAEFHHGDCQGADDQARAIAVELGYRIISHPPRIGQYRAYSRADVELPTKDYLARNHDIVEECDELVATPRLPRLELRSGTGSTVRYARRIGRRVAVVWPDGRVEES